MQRAKREERERVREREGKEKSSVFRDETLTLESRPALTKASMMKKETFLRISSTASRKALISD